MTAVAVRWLRPPTTRSMLAATSGQLGIAAPGTAIMSAVPTGSCPLSAPSGYRALTGTSMAAPHVAGAVAAYVARNPAVSTTGAPGELAQAALNVIGGSKDQASSCGFAGDPDSFHEPMLYVGIPDSDCGAIAIPDSDGDGLPDSVRDGGLRYESGSLWIPMAMAAQMAARRAATSGREAVENIAGGLRLLRRAGARRPSDRRER